MGPEDIRYFRRHLIGWYRENHRPLPWRWTHNPYAIWISEVMLQQTQVKTVLPYYRRFLDRFPDVTTLAHARLQDVLKVWEGLGYYARARNLHRAAKRVQVQYGGRIPDEVKEFRKLPGVGEYIASAVQSIAFDRCHPAVDGNVKRVLARLLEMDAPVNSPASLRIFREVSAELLDPQSPGNFNQAIMELGATVCRPQTPCCHCCPVQSLCLAYRAQRVDGYPKRIPTRPTPTHHLTVGIVSKGQRVLITRRKTNGLLGGLWEFPGGGVAKNEGSEAACVREIKEETNLSVEITSYVTLVRHAYTHFKVILDVFRCRYISGRVRLNRSTNYRWIKVLEIDQYPFPKAHHKFIPLLK
jgi:A/G-specific adenine glycosylase